MPEMKDSGIDWVGEIPKNWDVYRNRTLLNSIYSGGTPTSSNSEYYDVDGMPFITIADMSQTDYVASTKNGLTRRGILNKNLRILPPGTILYSIYATLGAVSETTMPSTISQAILALTPKNEICYKKFYKYNLMAQKDFVSSLSNKNTQSNLNAEIVKNLNIVVPPLNIQKKIANYLDSKCSEINSLRFDIKKEIETLEEYKKSIISETVTKGLDKNVEMKDSGIEWVGQIPANWEMKKLKYVSKVRSNKVSNNIGNDYFALENIVSWTGEYIETDNEYDTTGSIYCYKNDVAFGKLRPYLAKVYYVDYDRCCSSEFAVFYNFVGNSRYYYYVLLSKGFIDLANSATCGIKMPRVKIDFLNNMYIPIPPIKEQDAIADHLNNMCSEIDSIIINKKKQLETLDSYKKSIIYEYVTGKKEVPA